VMDGKPPTISAVMPVYNGRDYLQQSLPPLVAMLARGELLEIVVADDGSTDGSGDFCRAHGAQVVTTGGRKGPAEARNVASKAARGDIVWFVDADVVAHDDAAQHLQRAFAAPEIVAVFGSYDDTPPHDAFASQYMNLRHHVVHHQSPGEASTFWSGLGAVRREPFLAVGGYDAARFLLPSIEDIELGYRLRRAGGAIVLAPEVQGTHLKRWTLRSMVHTDIFCRALPWGRLLQHPELAGAVLNVSNAERLKALIGGAFYATLALALLHRPFLGSACGLLLVAALVSAPFYALLWRAAGPRTALAGLLLHQFYFVYGAATYVWCVLEKRLGLAPRPPRGKLPPLA